jgi:hypothetical protein
MTSTKEPAFCQMARFFSVSLSANRSQLARRVSAIIQRYPLSRGRIIMKNILFLTLLSVLMWTPAWSDEPTEITVYKTPTCGCCGKWIAHLEDNGFNVVTREMNDLTAIKTENGIPRNLASCHTGIVDGYVVEGHIPADVIRRLLKERPDIKGIAVPGMPAGSPGMEVASGVVQPYSVMTFDENGKSEVFETRGD